MANWPVNPSWVNPANINSGKQYNAADGVTANDINTIINDLRYLYGQSIAAFVQPLTVTPKKTPQYIVAPAGIDGYNPVSVLAVTAAVDPNIVPQNIRKNVNILGVTGTYESTDYPTYNGEVV